MRPETYPWFRCQPGAQWGWTMQCSRPCLLHDHGTLQHDTLQVAAHTMHTHRHRATNTCLPCCSHTRVVLVPLHTMEAPQFVQVPRPSSALEAFTGTVNVTGVTSAAATHQASQRDRKPPSRRDREFERPSVKSRAKCVCVENGRIRSPSASAAAAASFLAMADERKSGTCTCCCARTAIVLTPRPAAPCVFPRR